MTRSLVILAAGSGSRYGGLKQLAEVGQSGEALFEYTVYDALRCGFERVVIVIQPQAEAEFSDRLRAKMGERVPVFFAHQVVDDLPRGVPAAADRLRPWGTVHAVLAAERFVTEHFAVVNADDLYGRQAFRELADFFQRQPPSTRDHFDLALVGFPVGCTLTDSGPVSRAICRVDANALLEEIVELKEVWRRNGHVAYRDPRGAIGSLRSDEIVSMNMWGFSNRLFPDLRARFRAFLEREGSSPDAEYLLPDYVSELILHEERRVRVLAGADQWLGITFREDRSRVARVLQQLIDRGVYPKELWA